jgi:hypothetical protein
MNDGRTGTAGGRCRAKKRNQPLESKFCVKPFKMRRRRPGHTWISSITLTRSLGWANRQKIRDSTSSDPGRVRHAEHQTLVLIEKERGREGSGVSLVGARWDAKSANGTTWLQKDQST